MNTLYKVGDTLEYDECEAIVAATRGTGRRGEQIITIQYFSRNGPIPYGVRKKLKTLNRSIVGVMPY